MRKQTIGFWVLLPLILSAQLGSGAFFIPSLIAPFGFAGLLSWIYTGAGAIVIAIMFALLCSEIPQTGGPHVYIQRAFGNRVGFFSAWSYWVVSWLSSTVLLFLISASLNQVFCLSSFESLAIEVSILLVVMFINLFGIRFTGVQNAILTALKLSPIFIVCICGWFFINYDNFFKSNYFVGNDINSFGEFMFFIFSNISSIFDGKSGFLSSISSEVSSSLSGSSLGTNSSFSSDVSYDEFYKFFTLASISTLWAFVGIETATTPAENIKNVRKVILRSLIIGESLVCLIYFVSCFVIYGILGQDALSASASPYVNVLQIIFGLKNATFLPFLIMPVGIASLNTWTLVSGQIAFGAAKSELFPKFFSKTNRYGAPKLGIILSCVPQIPFLILARKDGFLEKITKFADFSSGFFFIIYFLSAMAFIKIFGKKYIFIGITSILFCLWIIFNLGITSIIYSLLLPLTGLFFYGKFSILKNK